MNCVLFRSHVQGDDDKDNEENNDNEEEDPVLDVKPVSLSYCLPISFRLFMSFSTISH